MKHPAALVGAAYGLTLRSAAPAAARGFVADVPSVDGQAVLQRHGLAQP